MEKNNKMIEILINEIDIENFKGCKRNQYSFDGQNVLITGRNTSGKTTIYEAYLWCLFQKCVSGSSDNVLPRQQAIDGELGEVIHKLKTSVFVTLQINGEKYLFGRTLEENWSKPRGTEVEELSGTISEYYFNSREIPCGWTTFRKHLSDICDANIWYICSNIDNFLRMKIQDRRDLLKSISPCKSDGEIADNYPLVKKAFDEKKSIDEFKKEVTQSLTKVKNEYDSIPDQKNAQEKLREIVDVEALNTEKQEVEQIMKYLDDMLQQNANSDLFKQIQEEKNKILKYQSYLQKRQDEIKKELDRDNEKFNNTVKAIQQNIDKHSCQIPVIQQNIIENEKTIKDFEDKITIIGQQWEKENNRVILLPERCDKCGSILTEDIKQKYLQENTSEKLRNLTAMENKATDYDEKIKKYLSDINDSKEEIKQLNDEIISLLKDKDKAEQELQTLPDIVTLCANDEECIKLSTELEKHCDILDNLTAQISVKEANQSAKLKEEKQQKLQRLEEINRELAKVDTNKRIDEEQANLDTRAKKLVADMDVLEQKLKQINEFKKERINYIEQGVSSLFAMCQFKMFEKNMTNDGEKDICTPYYQGIPIEEQNLATKIAMKIDICTGIMKAVNCKFPLFIDNIESIYPLPKIACQKILLKHVPDQSLFVSKVNI